MAEQGRSSRRGDHRDRRTTGGRRGGAPAGVGNRRRNGQGREPQGHRGPDRQERPKWIPKPGTAPAVDEPETPRDFDESQLPAGVKAELKGLPKDLADTVGAHILAAGLLLDVDPELAHRHAEAARRRAGRLPIVREAAAEAAYAAGHYDIALREFRAIRRMNGGDELLPVIADCERALGRHREALELLATLNPRTKNLGLRIECLLVEAGIRSDLGERGEAMRLLKSAISHKIGPKSGQARLRYAYASLLEDAGQLSEARRWYEAAAQLDPEASLDLADRMAELDGVVLPTDFDLAVPVQQTEAEPPAAEVTDPADAEETVQLNVEEMTHHDVETGDPADTEETVQLITAEEELAEIFADIDGEPQ